MRAVSGGEKGKMGHRFAVPQVDKLGAPVTLSASRRCQQPAESPARGFPLRSRWIRGRKARAVPELALLHAPGGPKASVPCGKRDIRQLAEVFHPNTNTP